MLAADETAALLCAEEAATEEVADEAAEDAALLLLLAALLACEEAAAALEATELARLDAAELATLEAFDEFATLLANEEATLLALVALLLAVWLAASEDRLAAETALEEALVFCEDATLAAAEAAAVELTLPVALDEPPPPPPQAAKAARLLAKTRLFKCMLMLPTLCLCVKPKLGLERKNNGARAKMSPTRAIFRQAHTN